MINKTKSLPKKSLAIIEDKVTEVPFSGSYEQVVGSGTYLCRRCGLALFRANAQFHSGCGWPSFDAAIAGAVAKQPDADGRRTEILCQRCQAHLGHVFTGEQFTPLNIRHCVNSISLDWVADQMVLDTEEAIVAAGCFWGVEYYFQRLAGVVKTEVGYCGGKQVEPTYQQVCFGNTGHYEAVRVIYDKAKINFTQIVKYFFEIHNFSQTNGQGPDIGEQYQSVIFYYDAHQQKQAFAMMKVLKDHGHQVATKLLPIQTFWPAENYHQHYYENNKKTPYCHHHQKIF